MARLAFVCLCLLLLGIWVHPFVSGAMSSVIKKQPGTQPIVDTKLEILRGNPGFWRLGKTADGVWWFISPTNEREFLNTVTTVQPFQEGRDPNGPHYVSRDWNGSVGKYDGDLHDWADKTLQRVRAKGFKGLGAWCHPIFHEFDVPITRDLNIWSHFDAGTYLMYHPDWSANAEKFISSQVSQLKDNRNLVGYYTDNELDWSDGSLGPTHYFNNLPKEDPNRQEVVKTLHTIWPTVTDFNQAWNTKFIDYSEIDSLRELPREPSAAYDRFLSVWLEKMATDYFRITTTLIRKHDPNHLILGVRFRGYAPAEVSRASKHYTDAQSINYYVSDALLDPDMYSRMYQESGQPIIISEYSFHALDGNSGNRNTFGFNAQVSDQQARADGYRLFTSRLARVPYIIGADWFQWNDEPPAGRKVDGEDVNFGVVDVDDQPYDLLEKAIRETTPRLNGLHVISPGDSQADVWRDSFNALPTMVIHKLDQPIHINGQLGEWSENNRITGIHMTNNVGSDRTDHQTPTIYMGWRDEGIYVGIEVKTRSLESMPATGRWWTRDYVELWLSTRPTVRAQQTYNMHAHQFFFVPSVQPTDGTYGTVGQWHRPGDAIADNLIPQPDIKQTARVLPDRYVVEMFIPAKALYGWDPKDHPEMAMNFNIRNFNQATNYYWSAPKEVATQNRPGTWGKIVLGD